MSEQEDYIPDEDFDAVNQEGSLSDSPQEPAEEYESVVTEDEELHPEVCSVSSCKGKCWCCFLGEW